MENKVKVDVLVGLQHGDEGKGKLVHELCKDYDVNVRFNGGSNSGHTVYSDNGDKVIFNVIPSGMLNPGITGVIAQGVVINPLAFTQEVDRVGLNIKDIKERLLISKDAHLTLPSHILIDIFTELSRSKSGTQIIGSTNRGNTPTYVDKVARRGLRISDIADPKFMDKYNDLTASHFKYIVNILGADQNNIMETSINGIPFNEYEILWHQAVEKMNSFKYCNTVLLLHEMCLENKRILLEGAQGLMLDVEYGTYPYCTSSSVTASAAFAQTGIPPQMIGKVFGVFKPYVTRVGNGFFPTLIKEENSLFHEFAEHVVKTGKEFGSVTGRQRMIGLLDMPQLKYASIINGVTDLVMMKCDVLSDAPGRIGVCERYEYAFPDHDNRFTDIYEGSDGFVQDVCTTFDKFGDISTVLSPELWSLIEYINDYMYDVITHPAITGVSCSPTAKFVRIARK